VAEVSAPRIRRVIEKIGTLELVPFDEIHAHQSARLRVPTKSVGLSLADRACLALGRMRQLPILTTDQIWRSLQPAIRIQVIR
jgi:ribonuclease VapC